MLYGESLSRKTEYSSTFDTEKCAINTAAFNDVIASAVSLYGADRKVVFAITDAESGEGKSVFLSLLVKCPSQFKSECKADGHIGGVTKGVWTHDKPLSCCALSYIHNIADTSKCDCDCYHDSRDLDATTNWTLREPTMWMGVAP